MVDFNTELLNLMEDVLKSKRPDENCLDVLKLHFAWKNIWKNPEVDLVFIFTKIYPQTFFYELPKTRIWFTKQCFQYLDPTSCEVLKMLFGINLP